MAAISHIALFPIILTLFCVAFGQNEVVRYKKKHVSPDTFVANDEFTPRTAM